MCYSYLSVSRALLPGCKQTKTMTTPDPSQHDTYAMNSGLSPRAKLGPFGLKICSQAVEFHLKNLSRS